MAKEGDTIAVWVSCGAASAVAAIETKKQYPQCNIRLLNNPVIEEHEDNRRFLDDLSNYLDHEIEQVINSKYTHCSAHKIWEQRKAMSFPKGAPCTLELKKRARFEWEMNNPCDHHVLGFTADEKSRHINLKKSELPELLPVLIDSGHTKQDCFNSVISKGLKLPEIYDLGYPNANCIGCVKATSPTYWNHVRKIHPEVFEQRAILSRELGAKLVRVKGERIYLDELDPKAKGRPLKEYNIECSIFCGME